eukprot:GGOE01002701.1.p1 GENE.GGOE01002701.1~~GGOE01002701.1.p1  ORF type:complete len:400 (-),score=87.63 GGOE01002701.1:255-1454(-)
MLSTSGCETVRKATPIDPRITFNSISTVGLWLLLGIALPSVGLATPNALWWSRLWSPVFPSAIHSSLVVSRRRPHSTASLARFRPQLLGGRSMTYCESSSVLDAPFDAHCHIHLVPGDPALQSLGPNLLQGVGLMSTRPADWDACDAMAALLQRERALPHVVRGYGVHPWHAHEVGAAPQGLAEREGSGAPDAWVDSLRGRLLADLHSVVGEIGLDAPWSPPGLKLTRTFPEPQSSVFRQQLALAAELCRPAILHAVQAWGPLMEALETQASSPHGLPTCLYFHAFSGKVGVVSQLLGLERRHNAAAARQKGPSFGPTRIYFGFALGVNRRSPKTPEVIRAVGLERLLLESDQSCATPMLGELRGMVAAMAEALGVPQAEVVRCTAANARRCYGLAADG